MVPHAAGVPAGVVCVARRRRARTATTATTTAASVTSTATSVAAHTVTIRPIGDEREAFDLRIDGIGTVMLPDVVDASAPAPSWSPLTERETDVLRAASDGGTVADIARELRLSEGTVRNHLSSAIGKTGARTRAEAVRLARDHGWLLA